MPRRYGGQTRGGLQAFAENVAVRQKGLQGQAENFVYRACRLRLRLRHSSAVISQISEGKRPET
jgi:hypothetical protein